MTSLRSRFNRPDANRTLTQQAREIWQAGVDAVKADRLLSASLRFDHQSVEIGDHSFPLRSDGRLLVVGAGKAAAAMAAGLRDAYLRGDCPIALDGLVLIPAGTERATEPIALHVGRPAGVNEPTAEAVQGARRILQRVSQLDPQDTCIALISGGGSALLALPAEGLTLDDKLATIRFLSSRGANIEQLNTVRKHLSAVKGGKLAAACLAKTLITVVISDVLGDPLDLIASGPTVPDSSTPNEALKLLTKFDAERSLPPSVYRVLEQASSDPGGAGDYPPYGCAIVLANNATAVDAAGVQAERLGWQHAMQSARKSEGAAEQVGQHLAQMAIHMLRTPGPNCLITGGEPTVTLAPADQRGKGGRNQQLVLAAMQTLLQCPDVSPADRARIVILSGGTDGEDGPTDAAGAWLDADVWRRAENAGLDLDQALARNDAYSFFDACGGLIHTGPTHTNVCDIRVVLVQREESPSG